MYITGTVFGVFCSLVHSNDRMQHACRQTLHVTLMHPTSCAERLEAIMAAKKKLLEFDSDFDDEDGSMHSSELSELDSDVHSLSSLKSCAASWIEDVEYKQPAEGWIKFATPAATVSHGGMLGAAKDMWLSMPTLRRMSSALHSTKEHSTAS